MSGKPVEITVEGRQVQGSVFDGKDKNDDGEEFVNKRGEKYKKYYVGLAIPKNDPAWPAIEAAIKQAAERDWPDGEHARENFAWKYVDGDSTTPDQNGKRPCDKAGFPGNYVLGFGALDAKPVYKFDQALGAYVELTDPKSIKLGDYIKIRGSVKGNGPVNKRPGVYLNLDGVLFISEGEAIIFKPTAEDMFGAAPNMSLPPGASATPVAPSTAMPTTGTASPPATGGTVVPAPGFLESPPPPPTAPPAVRYLLSNGTSYTQEQLTGAGYTPEMIASLPKA